MSKELPRFPSDSFEIKGYKSPVGEKYGSDEMDMTWDERYRQYKRRLVWIAAAQTQMKVGLVTPEEYKDLIMHIEDIDVETINRRETDESDPNYTGHDVLAHISQYREVASIGGRVLHRAMTSEDVLSNEEMMSIMESIPLIEQGVKNVLVASKDKIEENKQVVCLARTHLQAAEPTTYGYRIANYAQDFITALHAMRFLKGELRAKGIKGAVGTSASFVQLLKDTGMSAQEHEQKVMELLRLEPALVSGQTYPRIYAFLTLSSLATVGLACHKFTNDIKTLQATDIGEVAEPRSKKDRSSSAMVHKRNPRHSENTKSLTRSVGIGKLSEAWIGAADVDLERGLEDSAGKRSYLPEAFLLTDEALRRSIRIMKGLQIRHKAVERNFNQSAPFVAMEMILTELSSKGMDRQAMYDLLGEKAQTAWDIVEEGGKNPLREMILSDERIINVIPQPRINVLSDSVKDYIGDVVDRCEKMIVKIDEELARD